jgi:hypothetical protein
LLFRLLKEDEEDDATVEEEASLTLDDGFIIAPLSWIAFLRFLAVSIIDKEGTVNLKLYLGHHFAVL